MRLACIKNYPQIHCIRDKMATILQMTFSNSFFRMEIGSNFTQFVPRVRLTITWPWFKLWFGAKPLSEPMVALFTDAYTRQPALMS